MIDLITDNEYKNALHAINSFFFYSSEDACTFIIWSSIHSYAPAHFILSFFRSFFRSFVPSFLPSFMHVLACMGLVIRSFIHYRRYLKFLPSLFPSFLHSCMCLRVWIHSFIHSFIQNRT